MRTLALDLAMQTGWATHEIVRGKVVVHCGTAQLVGDNINKRMTEAEQALRNLIIVKAPNRVFVEGWVSKSYAKSIYPAVSLLREVERWCAKHGIPIEAIPPKEAKKHLTGNGNAKKDDMLESARRLYPHLNIEDHNAADALAVLSLGLERINETNETETP